MNFTFLTDTPKMFGYQHIIYLIISFLLTIVGVLIITFFVKGEKNINLTIRIIGFILFILIVWNRICLSIKNNYNFWYLIPDSYCGAASLLMSIAMMWGKKDNAIYHYFPYVGLVGGLCAVLFPNFLSQNESFFYPATISGLLHHSVLLFSIIVCFIKCQFRPTLKKFYIPIIFEIILVALGYFELYVLKFESAYNLTAPLISNTILTWWFVSILVFIVTYLVMFLYDLYYKIHSKNN